MRIYGIENNNQLGLQKKSNTTFKSWVRAVYKPEENGVKKLLYRNDTAFYRDDMDIIIKYIVERYKNFQKINFHDYACSNGTETYSYLIEMICSHGLEAVKKFLPIMAKDIDDIAIQKAKSNLVQISTMDKEHINFYTHGKFDDFFEKDYRLYEFDDAQKMDFTKISCDCSNATYKVKPILTDNVIYKRSNIFDCDNYINGDNNIVSARNFWPYLSEDQKLSLAEKLYNCIGKNSTLIIGSYDIGNLETFPDTSLILRAKGFLPTESEYIFITK